MTENHLFEIFIHEVLSSRLLYKDLDTIFEIKLADFQPLHICPKALGAAAPERPSILASDLPDSSETLQVICIAAGKRCTFLLDSSMVIKPMVECVISLRSSGGTQDAIGRARMRLRTQHMPPEALPLIWQQRPQALPLHCPATGTQTGLMCVSGRLVRLLPSQRKAEANQMTGPSSPRRCSQDDVSLTVSSELIVSSWPPLKNWGEHGWKEAIWSLQHQSSKAHATAWAPSRQEDAAAQPDAPDEAYHADTAHWPSREEAAHQRRFSKGAGGSSSAGMPHGTLVSADCCDGRAHCATHACQRGTRRWTDSGRSCSPQQAEHRTVLTGPPGRRFGEGHPACTAASHGTDALLPKPSWRQQQVSMGHGRHRHGAELSEVAVSISRSTLGAVMRDLAKGLADIRELRCTAEKAGLPSDQAASPLCDRPTSPHDQPPGSQAPAREGSRRAQLSASRPGSAQPEAGLQASQHSAGSRGSRTAEHGSHKAGQRLGASPMGRKKGDHLLHVQQPTGHPMVRWRTSLRSTERPCRTHVPSTRKIPEPRSAGGPRTPASHKNSSKDLPCSGDPSAGVSQQSAVPQRCRAQPVVHRRPGESSGHGVAVLHARPRTGIEGSHRQERHLEHKQGGTALPIAGLIAEQQPCQEHLRQRYLPVYSVFGEKASAADCPDELLCACLARQCTPKAADTPEASAAVEAAQQWQIGNEISLHASSASTHADQARKVQRLHVDNKCSRAQPEHTKSELPSVQEDILRAALQSFAMRTA